MLQRRGGAMMLQRCDDVTVLLRRYSVAMVLQCYDIVTVLRCYSVVMALRRCDVTTLLALRCYDIPGVTMLLALRCYDLAGVTLSRSRGHCVVTALLDIRQVAAGGPGGLRWLGHSLRHLPTPTQSASEGWSGVHDWLQEGHEAVRHPQGRPRPAHKATDATAEHYRG